MNKAYFIYKMKDNRKGFGLHVLISVFLFAVLGLFLSSKYVSYMYSGGYMPLPLSLMGIYLVIVSVWYALRSTQGYHKQQERDTFHSLPITKSSLLFHDVIFGWMQVFVPYLISIVVYVLGYILMYGHSANLHVLWEVVPYFILSITTLTLIYVVYVFAALHANNTMDALILIGLYSIVMMLFSLTVRIFLASSSPNMSWYYQGESFFEYFIALLTPFSTLLRLNDGLLQVNASMLSFLYVILAAVMFLLCFPYVKKHKMEMSGQKSDSWCGYPLITFLVCVLFSILLASGASQMETSLLVFWFGVLFVFYLMVMSIANRKFSVKSIMLTIPLFLAAVAFSFGLRAAFVETAGFGNFIAYPEYKEVASVSVTIGEGNTLYIMDEKNTKWNGKSAKALRTQMEEVVEELKYDPYPQSEEYIEVSYKMKVEEKEEDLYKEKNEDYYYCLPKGGAKKILRTLEQKGFFFEESKYEY